MADKQDAASEEQHSNTKSIPWYWFMWRIIPHSHGVDNMMLIDTLPETFGSYEIWQCTKCKFTEAI